MAESKVMEDHGISSKTGVIFNPFGAKPQWAIAKAAKLRDKHKVQTAEEALF